VFVIHRAFFGSFERFIGILIEHYAGAFPAWLAPVQVRLIPIADRHRDEVGAVAARLRHAGVRVDLDERDETVSKRVRDAELQKVPYTIVYGDKDSPDALAVRNRDEEGLSTASVDGLVRELAKLRP
jgi:threonyl-tRNA synthetase